MDANTANRASPYRSVQALLSVRRAVAFATVAAIGIQSVPANAYHWVTFTGRDCTKRGFPSPCKFYMPTAMRPPTVSVDEFDRSEQEAVAKAQQVCLKTGGKWRILNGMAVCDKRTGQR